MSYSTRKDVHEFADALRSARAAFASGENIQSHLETHFRLPRQQAIEIAYSLQAGTYTRASNTRTVRIFHETCMEVLAKFSGDTGNKRCLDFGIGEGTAWTRANSPKFAELYGIDILYRRLHWCKQNISALQNFTSIKSDGTIMPFADRSLDVVTAMHALESNSDALVRDILQEIARVTNEFVILFEPNYDTAHESMHHRMETHGYSKNTWSAAKNLTDFEILADIPFEESINPDNATSCLVLRRRQSGAKQHTDSGILTCPLSGNFLNEADTMLVDSSGTFGYPRYKDTLFLNPSDAIFIDDTD